MLTDQPHPTEAANDDEHDLVKQDVAATILGMSEAWLERCRWAKEGPPYHKFGRAVRYSRRELREWKNTKRVVPA